MDVDSTCPVPTEAYFIKQTEVPYRRVELYSNTKLHGANSDIDKSLKREKSHGILLKDKIRLLASDLYQSLKISIHGQFHILN